MEKPPSIEDQFLSTINLIIDDNLDNENFSVEDLAQEAGLSRSMLHRKLIKLTGKSATDLITERRLIRAKELLENNAATASEIAYKVGFSSPSYFNTVFKKYFKISPGRIRKNVAANQQPFSKGLRSEPEGSIRIRTRRLIYITVGIALTAIIIGGIYYLSREKEPYEKSIAILPFDNLSPDEENQYFADGIVEDLLNRISLIDDLKVISRTSSEMFRNKGNKSIPEIAGLLGVGYILEGSVRREVDKIRISVQLIDAHKDDHILSKQYNRNIGEVFKIQGEIAGQIANELSIYLSNDQLKEIQRNQTDNVEAFNYYQMGHFHYCMCTEEEVLASIDYFNKAIEADSNYALVYAGLASAYWFLGKKDTAIMMALKALEIDYNLAEAHAALGTIYMESDLNIEAAEKEFLTAIEVNPNSSEAYKEYAEFLSVSGRHEKAREYMDKAVILDPLTFNIRHISTNLYMAAGNYSKALEENKICLELVKDHPRALDKYFYIYLGLGNEEVAYESLRKFVLLSGTGPVEILDSTYKAAGIEGILRLMISRRESLFKKAEIYILLGEYEKAIEMLELEHNRNQLEPFRLYYLANAHKELESYPRFKALKKELGLQDY